MFVSIGNGPYNSHLAMGLITHLALLEDDFLSFPDDSGRQGDGALKGYRSRDDHLVSILKSICHQLASA
jgi:hypothetical protein